MAEDGPKLKAMREMGQPELARRFATADGKPQRTQAAPIERVKPEQVRKEVVRNKPDKPRFAEPARDKASPSTVKSAVTRAAPKSELESPQIPYAKAVRLLTGLTQVEFAAANGFSRRTFEGWERGASEPNAKAHAKLAEIETKAKGNRK